MRVRIANAFVASRITIEPGASVESIRSPLAEFWYNFRHNLFKPLLLFFYLGFVIVLLRVEYEIPYVVYQALTIYLLLAIGWHGGEELAGSSRASLGPVLGFMVHGLRAQFRDRNRSPSSSSGLATHLREVDQATVAGYLRFGLGRDVRHLPGRPRRHAHRLRRLHARDARRDGDPRLPGGALSRLAAPAPGDGRAGQHAPRAGL